MEPNTPDSEPVPLKNIPKKKSNTFKSVMQWTDLLRNIASIVGAFISVFTLIILLRQNERTYQPDLIATQVGGVYKMKYKGLPANCDDILLESTDSLEKNNLRLVLVNVGLAAARDIRLEWIYDGTKMVDTLEIHGFPVPTESSYAIDFKQIAFSNCLLEETLVQKTNYVLPVTAEKTQESFSLPKNYLFALHNILIRYFAAVPPNAVDLKRALPEILHAQRALAANLQFKDVNGKSHEKKLRVQIIPLYINLPAREWVFSWQITEGDISPEKNSYRVFLINTAGENLVKTVEL